MPQYDGLTDVGGTLYGTTYDGASSGEGTIFRTTTSGTDRRARQIEREIEADDQAAPIETGGVEFLQEVATRKQPKFAHDGTE